MEMFSILLQQNIKTDTSAHNCSSFQ